MDEAILRSLFGALSKHGVEYALVGGIALQVHGVGRTTEDVDLFIAPGETNVERLRAALNEVFRDPELRELRIEDFDGEYGVVRYLPPEHDFEVDLLSGVGEAFRFTDLTWIEREFLGVSVRVADPATLVRMKQGTMRERDRQDAALLRERFGLEEG
jgi:hypothetical protein